MEWHGLNLSVRQRMKLGGKYCENEAMTAISRCLVTLGYRTLAYLIPYSYQPGDLIASLKKLVLWPIQRWALFSIIK
jgi:hypothetical protein